MITRTAVLILAVLGYSAATRIQPRQVIPMRPATAESASMIESEAHTVASKTAESEHSHVHSVAHSVVVTPTKTDLPKILLFSGVGAFVLVAVCCIWMLMGRVTHEEADSFVSDKASSKRSSAPRESRVSADSGSSKSTNSSSGAGSFSNRTQYMHNGKVVYEWAQTDAVAMVFLKAPDNKTKDDFEVEITTKRLAIALKGKHKFLNEEIYDNIDVDGSMWKLSKKGELAIHMAKSTNGDWPVVLVQAESTPDSGGSGTGNTV